MAHEPASTNVFVGGIPDTNTNILSDEVTTETKVGALADKAGAKFSITTVIAIAVLILGLGSLLSNLRGR